MFGPPLTHGPIRVLAQDRFVNTAGVLRVGHHRVVGGTFAIATEAGPTDACLQAGLTHAEPAQSRGTRQLGVTGRGQRDHATQEDAFAYRYPWID